MAGNARFYEMLRWEASAYYGASFKTMCERLGVSIELEVNDEQVICKISRGNTLKAMAPKTLKKLAKQPIEKPVES